MVSALLYYLIILPISWLPYFIVYRISDFFFLMLYYLIPYRKKLVLKNLRNSFPDKSEEELKTICRKFYRHFCDIILESLKCFSISEKIAHKRFKIRNPQVGNAISDKGQNYILAGGHLNNWEMPTLIAPEVLKCHPLIVFKSLTNKFFDEKVKRSRGRYGSELVSMQGVRERVLKEDNKTYFLALMTDQSPSNPKKAYWTKFLNQDTAVLFGTERYAKKFNLPVVFFVIEKVKRGYYEATFKLLTDTPNDTPDGYITETHTAWLEEAIIKNPQYWLWTHKRWKHEKQ